MFVLKISEILNRPKIYIHQNFLRLLSTWLSQTNKIKPCVRRTNQSFTIWKAQPMVSELNYISKLNVLLLLLVVVVVVFCLFLFVFFFFFFFFFFVVVFFFFFFFQIIFSWLLFINQPSVTKESGLYYCILRDYRWQMKLIHAKSVCTKFR